MGFPSGPSAFTSRPSSRPRQSQPKTHRAQHIAHLTAVFHLSLLRNDSDRARRAWGILVGLRETVWEDWWVLGSALLRDFPEDNEPEELDRLEGRREDWLEGLMRGGGTMSVPLLNTYTQHLLIRSPPQFERALERLDLFLPGLPYAVSPELHLLAALCALGIAFEHSSPGAPPATSDHRTALTYLDKAIGLIPQTAPSVLRELYTDLYKLIEEIGKGGYAFKEYPPDRDSSLSDSESGDDSVIGAGSQNRVGESESDEEDVEMDSS
ncbi:Transcription initiation factor Rrn11 [Phaffia rhodozyma]|uniref:Transcription initiation factor Rrn11 n=1 Tax=Phaffia rhodozyma TaxID=264483 RepID=A0A0F7SMN4_PHARH|nr:Transcription initiation factor Rrn11 [Phaffia rhodozyma]